MLIAGFPQSFPQRKKKWRKKRDFLSPPTRFFFWKWPDFQNWFHFMCNAYALLRMYTGQFWTHSCYGLHEFHKFKKLHSSIWRQNHPFLSLSRKNGNGIWAKESRSSFPKRMWSICMSYDRLQEIFNLPNSCSSSWRVVFFQMWHMWPKLHWFLSIMETPHAW